MVKAMGAVIAAAMAQVLNNANNDNNNNQGAPRAPVPGAHDAVEAADGAQPPQAVRGARAASCGRGAAAQPPAPLSPEAQLIAQLQRQMAALQAELQRLREENLAQWQQPQGAAPAQPRGGIRTAGGAAAPPSSLPSAVAPAISHAASPATGPSARCRGPTIPTRRCTDMFMRCPAPAGGISPRGRRTPTARGGRGIPAWLPPPTRGSAPATGHRTRAGLRGSTLASAGAETTARPAARRHPGISHLPCTLKKCGTRSHMGTARWWPRRRVGPWAWRTNAARWSKARRCPLPLRPRLPAVLLWRATPLRPRRGHWGRHIPLSSSWPRGPPLPSRPSPGHASWCSRRRSDPGALVSPCSPPRSTCCSRWRARRALQASCRCRAPSRNATSLPCERRAQAVQRRLRVACAGQGGHIQGALGLGGHGGGSPRHRWHRPWAVRGGAGRLHHRAGAVRAEGAMLCGARAARAAPVQGRRGGAGGHPTLPAPDPPGALGVLYCGGGRPGPAGAHAPHSVASGC